MALIEIEESELAGLREQLAKAESKNSELFDQLMVARNDARTFEADLSAANAERDKVVAGATAAHREAVLRAEVANALAPHAASWGFSYAVDAFLRETKIQRSEDGTIKSVELPDGRTFVNLQVAGERYLAERAKIFHRDWDAARGEVVTGEVSSRHPLQEESAVDFFSRGLSQLPKSPVTRIRAAPSHAEMQGMSVEELLNYPHNNGPDAA